MVNTASESQPAAEPPRRKVPRTKREPQMIESAIRTFAQHGYHGASMDKIAAGASVTKPMLYAYFDSKEGLLAACIDHAAGGLVEGYENAIDKSLPPDQQLWEGSVAFFSFVEQNREWWTAVYLQAAVAGGEPAVVVERVRAEIIEILTRMISEQATATMAAGVDVLIAPHIEPVARAFVGAAEALAAWWIEHHSAADKETMALRLVSFAWRGFEQLSQSKFWIPPSGIPPGVTDPRGPR